ncbi:MAG: aldehyde dehydrogenase family protein [Candidatus Hodarchaeales archaeon]|jgi:acyl-CoA reductase-like NAD-dependent aldehyde dehydrogenase
MGLDQEQIARVVEEVVRKYRAQQAIPMQEQVSPAIFSQNDGIFASIDDALNAAEQAFEDLMELTLENRKNIIAAMRAASLENAEHLAQLAHEETGLGRVDHKVIKNRIAAIKTPGTEDLVSTTYSGDDGLTLVEMGPYGVIGAITPSTNPTSTVINNSIGMVAAGNAVVFNPHPGAKRCSNETIRILNRAIMSAGGPANLLGSTANPTIESSSRIMKHPQVKLLVVTGGGGVVKAAMSSGKNCIAAGPGNPPVIVDDTADLQKAGKYIVDGATFDNNILCTAEKEVFVFRSVADRLKEEMKRYGAYEVSSRQIDELVRITVEDTDSDHPHPNPHWIGKDARLILEELGVNVGNEISLIIAEVDERHPFVIAEMLMPILAIIRVDDIHEALEKAKRAEHGFKHTAIMHSDKLSNLAFVARQIETTIFVKNAPSYAGLGVGGEGFTTLSIAGPTGQGLTSARCFTRQRRCVLKDAFRIV